MRYFVTILLIFMLSGQAVGVAGQAVHGAPRQGVTQPRKGVIPPEQEAVQSGKEQPSYQETAEAVGIGAVIFYYLSANKIRDINFVMQDALNFDGNTGPYAQYTYARTCGILDKASAIDLNATAPIITSQDEANLLKVLSKFNEAIKDAIKEYEPSVITRYIIDVCTAFNKFYHNCQIVNADDESVRNTRIRLTNATKTVLGSAFDLICLKKTEKI